MIPLGISDRVIWRNLGSPSSRNLFLLRVVGVRTPLLRPLARETMRSTPCPRAVRVTSGMHGTHTRKLKCGPGQQSAGCEGQSQGRPPTTRRKKRSRDVALVLRARTPSAHAAGPPPLPPAAPGLLQDPAGVLPARWRRRRLRPIRELRCSLCGISSACCDRVGRGAGRNEPAG